MSASSSLIPNHTHSLFRSRLCAALRSALACMIIGVTTVYTPSSLREYLKFPAFSYVVSVLIVSDATLGHAIRGAILAIYATVLGLLPALLTLYMIRPEGISTVTTTIAVAVSSFVAVLSDTSEGLIAKRIALGQIVLVYVAAFNFKIVGGNKAVLHPVPVAASTAVGVAAAVIALVVPYPRLACYEVREKSKMYADMTMERLRLFVNAFCADDKSGMIGSISQAKSIGRTCNKLLHKIRCLQEIIQWERPPLKFLPPYMRSPFNRLQEIETQLKGMEIALAYTTSIPTKTFQDPIHLKNQILNLHNQITVKTLDDNGYVTFDKTSLSLQSFPQNFHDLPSFFFIFCMKLLSNKNPISKEESINPSAVVKSAQSTWSMNVNRRKLLSALKCSLTLGLAVFLGLLYSKEAGYWAGLTVATTFAPVGESTFKLASLRANGTAIGSIYGIFGSLISQNLMEIRLLALVPWIVFTSFLQRSKMYGQAGAMSAVLSGMIIMGRRYYGSPITFTIDRLVETHIALCCSILIEFLFQPTRASSFARSKLTESLQNLHECFDTMTCLMELREKEKKLRQAVKELKKYIEEAEMEPNFWFLPFSTTCYNKLYGSLFKMDELLFFMVRAFELMTQESYTIDETMQEDLDQFKEISGTPLKCFEEIIQVKSLQKLENELEERIANDDIELGKAHSSHGEDQQEYEKIIAMFLPHSKEMVENFDEELGREMKTQLVLCFATIGFCMGVLTREMVEIEKGVHEHVQWENPNSYINLHEISYKIRELSTA